MPYIEVDVDMSDFETDDLVKEILRRLKDSARSKRITASEKIELRDSLEPLNYSLSLSVSGIEINSLEDKMKVEYLGKIWKKYRYFEIEKALPE